MLEELDDKEDSEYINASFIDGYYSRVEFIVTQHPLTNTKADLWRMLLERSVSCLVVFGPLKDPEVLHVMAVHQPALILESVARTIPVFSILEAIQ